MDDLPNELLDEIFGYIHPVMHTYLKPTKVSTVCRRWNRPFMTRELASEWMPKGLDLQAKFPKLVSLELKSSSNTDEGYDFKGHPTLRILDLERPISLRCLYNVPRLTHLNLVVDMHNLFNASNLASLMTSCPTLVDLYLLVNDYSSSEFLPFRARRPRLTAAEILERHEKSERDTVAFNKAVADILERRDCHYQGLLNLKKLALYLSLDERDVDSFPVHKLFKSPSLEFLNVNEGTLDSNDQVREFFALFPNVHSMILGSSSMLMEGIEASHDCVKRLKVKGDGSKIPLEFSLITRQFPNLETLMTLDTFLDFEGITEPTRLSKLHMNLLLGDLQPSLFPYLQDLKSVFSKRFNEIFRELQVHCPQLAKMYFRDTSYERDQLVVPEFDHVTFPCLTHFKMEGPFIVNLSFLSFLARHSKLESLECNNDHDPDHDSGEIELTLVQSDTVFWPHLSHLRLIKMLRETDDSVLKWFTDNAPNAKIQYANEGDKTPYYLKVNSF